MQGCEIAHTFKLSFSIITQQAKANINTQKNVIKQTKNTPEKWGVTKGEREYEEILVLEYVKELQSHTNSYTY